LARLAIISVIQFSTLPLNTKVKRIKKLNSTQIATNWN